MEQTKQAPQINSPTEPFDPKHKYRDQKHLLGVSVGHFTNDFFAGLIAPLVIATALTYLLAYKRK
jgi:hypothetical protein